MKSPTVIEWEGMQTRDIFQSLLNSDSKIFMDDRFIIATLRKTSGKSYCHVWNMQRASKSRVIKLDEIIPKTAMYHNGFLVMATLKNEIK